MPISHSYSECFVAVVVVVVVVVVEGVVVVVVVVQGVTPKAGHFYLYVQHLEDRVNSLTHIARSDQSELEWVLNSSSTTPTRSSCIGTGINRSRVRMNPQTWPNRTK